MIGSVNRATSMPLSISTSSLPIPRALTVFCRPTIQETIYIRELLDTRRWENRFLSVCSDDEGNQTLTSFAAKTYCPPEGLSYPRLIVETQKSRRDLDGGFSMSKRWILFSRSEEHTSELQSPYVISYA